jgi:hypothetical protein
MSEQTPGPAPDDDAPTQPVPPYGAPPSPQQPQQPPYQTPYGQPAYGQPPYQPPQQPPYGSQPQYGYGYPQPPGYATPAYGGYSQPTPTPGSTIALVVVSGICTLGCLFGIPSLVLGIIALTKVNTNIAETRRLTRIGWIVFGVVAALAVLAIIVIIAIAASTSSSSDYTFDTLRAHGTTAQLTALRST